MDALGGSRTTGWDWVITAFELVRQYCASGVKLLLNEYNILHSNSQTNNYINLITLPQDQGLVDGIGVQGHYFEFRSHVRLVLVNVLGEEVVNIADSNFEPGMHQVQLNASRFAARVYFYRMEAGHFISIEKLVLRKRKI